MITKHAHTHPSVLISSILLSIVGGVLAFIGFASSVSSYADVIGVAFLLLGASLFISQITEW